MILHVHRTKEHWIVDSHAFDQYNGDGFCLQSTRESDTSKVSQLNKVWVMFWLLCDAMSWGVYMMERSVQERA